MANLTAVREDQRKDGVLRNLPVAASTKLFKGSLVGINTAGFAVKAADTASFGFAGVCYETADNSAGAAGDIPVRFWGVGTFEFAFSGTATQATVGQKVYAVDDNTVTLAATTTNDVLVGKVVEFVSANVVRVSITPDA